MGLSLRAVGYGSSLSALGQVAPRVKANRVLFERAGLSEWYVNGPLGLEQGFTVARAPSRHPAGPLTLSLALSGNAHASLASDGQAITLNRAGGPSLRYGQLSALDATGRRLSAHMQLRNGTLQLQINDSSARYPLRIDPLIQQAKLTASEQNGPFGAAFGSSVALSSDGNTALIGGYRDNNFAGAAWVFTRSESGIWTEQAKLTTSDESREGTFGERVALSGDGNTALIGGSGDNGGTGAAWVFTRSGSTWTEQAKLIGRDANERRYFGFSVALSADGNTALVGGFGDQGNVGAAWAFTRSQSGTWTEQEKLTSSNEIREGTFGYSVALSADGNTALIGGPQDNWGGEETGAAWVFTRSGSTWTEQAKLTAGFGEWFGYSVALSGDGNTALIGTVYHGPDLAWVFTRSGTTWTEQAKLTGSGKLERGFFFGYGLALSADGNTALVSDPGDPARVGEANEPNVGAAWVFTRSVSTWTQQGEKRTASDEIGKGAFGESVALSANGNTALIGGDGDNGGVGAAWVFGNSPTVVSEPASSVTQTSASLNATVNPNGKEVSDCHFEYGTSTSYSNSVPCASLPGSGESPVAVSAPVGSLSKNATYHFRIVATNPGGTSYGSDQTLTTLSNPTPTTTSTSLSGAGQSGATITVPEGTAVTDNATLSGENAATATGRVSYKVYSDNECKTLVAEAGKVSVAGELVPASNALVLPPGTYYWQASYSGDSSNLSSSSECGAETLRLTTLPNSPTVVSEPASLVTQTSASLNATVNPSGQTVSDCHFEYGTSTSYGSTAPCSSLPGSGESPVAVSASLTGLSPNTTYHFQICATNAGGTTCGSDQTVELPPYPTVESKGSTPGTVEVVGPPGTLVSPLAVEPVSPVGLPPGAVAVVGGLSFSVSGIPVAGSVDVTLNLPPGSAPTNVYKLVGGIYNDVTSLSTISGDSVTMHLTDGGPGDEDGLANGVIVDPLVPVRQPQPPAVVTGAASSVTQTSATLNATVSPNGQTVSNCRFEYGTSTSYGSTAPCASLPGSGKSPVAVSGSVTGLAANTTYHFRISATNPVGTSKGSDQTLKTLPKAPTVVTAAASSVTQTSATLNAAVNPNGGAVSACRFEYGASTSYANTVPCASLPGSGSGPVAVSAPVGSLSANTTYHFRISATNAGGTSKGSDQTLTTLSNPPEYGRCLKVAGEKQGTKTIYHGAYTGATCLEKSATKTGQYEWYSGVAKAGFRTINEGVVTLETVTKVKLTCRTERGKGQYSGTKGVANVIVRFTGCETAGHKCTTSGLAQGELETKTLEGAIGWEVKATKRVALDLYPVGKTGPFMEYRCAGGFPITVKGSILVPVTADKMLVTAPLEYRATAGKQKPEKFEGGEKDVLLSSLNGGAAQQSGLTLTSTQTNEEAVEIKTVV